MNVNAINVNANECLLANSTLTFLSLVLPNFHQTLTLPDLTSPLMTTIGKRSRDDRNNDNNASDDASASHSHGSSTGGVPRKELSHTNLRALAKAHGAQGLGSHQDAHGLPLSAYLKMGQQPGGGYRVNGSSSAVLHHPTPRLTVHVPPMQRDHHHHMTSTSMANISDISSRTSGSHSSSSASGSDSANQSDQHCSDEGSDKCSNGGISPTDSDNNAPQALPGSSSTSCPSSTSMGGNGMMGSNGMMSSTYMANSMRLMSSMANSKHLMNGNNTSSYHTQHRTTCINTPSHIPSHNPFYQYSSPLTPPPLSHNTPFSHQALLHLLRITRMETRPEAMEYPYYQPTPNLPLQ